MGINNDEKIDYIYNTLQKQESRYLRGIYYKWAFRILIIGYLYYFIIVSLPIYIDMFKDSMTPDIGKSVTESINNINKKELINKFKSLLNR